MKNDVAPALTRAGKKEWLGLAVLTLPTLLVSIDSTVTYLALPSMSTSLKPTSSELLWITDMFTFMEAGFLIIMGAAGDRIGRKRLLTIGMISFTCASLMAAFAQSATLLIAARALLGITGAIILPCTLSLIRIMFLDDRQRTVAFGIYTTCYSGGTMLGPLFGGILLSYFWWGSVFLISVPLMVLFLGASVMLPEYRDPSAKQFHLLSAVLLLAGMLPVIYSIKKVAETGSWGWEASLLVVTGVALCVLFLRVQKRVHNPLVDLTLFKIPAVAVTLSTLFLSLFCWAGLYLFMSQYLQLVLELTPLKAGIFTLLPVVLTMSGCMLAPQTLKWFRRSVIIIAGNLIMLAGIVMLSQLHIFPGLIYIMAAATFLNLGCGLVVTLGIDTIVSVAPEEQAGAVSGISESSTTFGAAFGVAILGSIGTAIYHTKMSVYSEHIADLPVDAANTLGSALVSAKLLAPSKAAALVETARHSFIDSFRAATIVAAILVLLMTIIFSRVTKRKLI